MSQTYRQQMAEKTKQHITHTALRLFQEHGYSNVSISDIVEAAGISRGGFYAHFKNKDDLLWHTFFDLDERYEVYYNNILSSPDTAGMSPLEQLYLFTIAINEIMAANGPELVRMQYSYAMRVPPIFVRTDRVYDRIVLELLDKAEEEGLLDTSMTKEQVFNMFLSLNRSILIDWSLKDGEYPITDSQLYIKWYCTQIASRAAREGFTILK